MLQRMDYRHILDQRGGLADDEQKVGILFSTAVGICKCAQDSVGLWKFFPEPYSSQQTFMMVQIAHHILIEENIWAELPPIDLERDNDPSELPWIIGLAQLEKNQLIVSKYEQDKILTTLPLATICELNRHLARMPGLFA